jgi:RHS repeat-associated protein
VTETILDRKSGWVTTKTKSRSEGTLQSLTRQHFDLGGRLDETDTYYNLAGVTDSGTNPNWGQEGTNFYRTREAYDSAGRHFLSSSADGTVTWTAFDDLGRPTATWFGADDGTTVSGGPEDMGLVQTDETVYDNAGVGDGNVTATRTYYQAYDLNGDRDGVPKCRETRFYYDWRNRLVITCTDATAASTPGTAIVRTLDNLGRATEERTYDGSATIEYEAGVPAVSNGTLLADVSTDYDDRGYVYRVTQHPVGNVGANPSGGLVTNYWHDGRGNVVLQQGPDGVLEKAVYDGAGRLTASLTETSDERVISGTFTEYAGDRVSQTRVGLSEETAELVSECFYDTHGDGTGASTPWLTAVKTRNMDGWVSTKYEYDAAGRPYATVLPDGTRTVQTFDALDRPLVTKTLKGPTLLSQTRNIYDPQKPFLTSSWLYKDSSTNDYLETSYAYDDLGRLCKVTEPGGAFTKTRYDEYDTLLGTYLGTDEGGTDDAASIDGDTLLEQTLPSYDDAGQVWLTRQYSRKPAESGYGTLTTDNARVTSTATWFDELGRVAEVVDYGTDATAAAAHGSSGPAPGASTDYNVTVYGFDAYGRPYQTTDNAGHITRTFYDSSGRTQYVVENYTGDFDPENDTPGADTNRTTGYVYNDAGQMVRETAFAGEGTRTGQITTYVYAFDLTDKGCPVVRGDLLRAVICPDSDDFVSSGSLESGSDETYDRVETTYYADGSVKTRTDQRGVVHTYTYDAMGREVSDAVTLPEESAVDATVLRIDRTYDDWGRLATITSYGDDETIVNQVAYDYGPWGGVATSWQSHSGAAVTTGTSQSPSVRYEYEGAGSGAVPHVRLTSVIYPDGREVAYHYTGDAISDKLSRVASIGDLQFPYARFTYLGADMIVEVDHPAVTGGLTLSYGADGSAGLDGLGRVVDQKWTTGEGETETTVDEFTYGYDLSGNRMWRNVVPAESPYDVRDETYTYDCLNRLTEVRRGTVEGETIEEAGYAQSWILDAVGNWDNFTTDADGAGSGQEVTEAREHDAANEITSIPGGITPAYDAAGNMVSGPKPGSAPGDGQTGQTYTFDAWNRLVAVEEWTWDDANEDGVFQAGEKSTPVPVAEYQYDGLNRRTAKLVYDAPSETWTRTDFYYNEDWQVLEERLATNVEDDDKGQVASAPSVQYLWDPRFIDSAVLRWRNANPEDPDLEETLYYTTDANFNVTSLVDPDGAVVERYVYDAYGTVTVLDPDWSPRTVNASALGNVVLFTGHPLDGETGLYYARARYLQPALGIWLSPDPAGYTDGMNVYEYCTSNPMRASDPTGQWAEYEVLPGDQFLPGRASFKVIHVYEAGVVSWFCGGLGEYKDTIYIPSADWYHMYKRAFFTQVMRNNRSLSALGSCGGYAAIGMETAISASPYADLYGVLTGQSIVTGDKLTGWERALSVAGICPGIGHLADIKACEKFIAAANKTRRAKGLAQISLSAAVDLCEGIKAARAGDKEGVAASIRRLEEAGDLRGAQKVRQVASFANTIEKHHMLPLKHAEFFRSKGLDPEAYAIPLERWKHRLKPTGIHTSADHWNAEWGIWIKNHQEATTSAIMRKLDEMKNDFGLD